MTTTNDCSGYHWSQGQYVVSSCSQESSTFFIILGFTMLVLVLLMFVVVVIACIRRQRTRTRAQQTAPLSSQENEDDCVINMDGLGSTGGSLNGRNLEDVKTVIMAGEERPTYIAHPVLSSSPWSSESPLEGGGEGQEVSPEEEEKAGEEEQEQQVNPEEPSILAVVPHEVV